MRELEENKKAQTLCYVVVGTKEGVTTDFPGVAKKIASCVRYFESQGLESKVQYVEVPHLKLHRISTKTPFLPDFMDWRLIPAGMDCYWLRSPVIITKKFVKRVQELKQENPQAKILYEVPTWPVENELTGISGFLGRIQSNLNAHALAQAVDHIVSPSGAQEIFGKEVVYFRNGIEPTDNPLKLNWDESENLQLISVASFAAWHGVDRLIAGMGAQADFVREKGIILHLVGEGIAVESLKSQVQSLGLDENIQFHGRLTGSALNSVYDQANMAVASLGIHRRGNNALETSLKIPEYFARGFAIVHSADFEYLTEGIKPYCFRVTQDEEPIDIRSLYDFWESLRAEQGLGNVARMLNQFSQENLTWDASLDQLMKKVGVK